MIFRLWSREHALVLARSGPAVAVVVVARTGADTAVVALIATR